jgi:magnesium-transporting ATPase (P-type)
MEASSRVIARPAAETRDVALATFWTQTPEAICGALGCTAEGLSSAEAERRLAQYGPNSDAEARADGLSRAITRRLLEPLSLILLAAGTVAVATGDPIGGSIIVAILALSIGLDTVQEGAAIKAAAILRRSIALKAEANRDGQFRQIDVERVVPGDILRVRAGDIIPADALIIPFDGVRPEATARPQVWNMRALVWFAGVMGPLSSLFDFLTFGALLLLFSASPAEFRTAWLLESMATQILVIFIIRTNGRPWKDRPRPILAASSLIALAVAVALPFTPAGTWFRFEPPPAAMLAGIGVIVVTYLVVAERLKPLALAPPLRPRAAPQTTRRRPF